MAFTKQTYRMSPNPSGKGIGPMKARYDLKPKDTEVLSSPNNFYIDPHGQVNELEDNEERILFGTVENPGVALHENTKELIASIEAVSNAAKEYQVSQVGIDPLEAEMERDPKGTMDIKKDPHYLDTMKAIFGILDKK